MRKLTIRRKDTDELVASELTSKEAAMRVRNNPALYIWVR
jgi:hypothetical protein